MRCKARDFKPGMVYEGSSGDMRMRVLASQPQTMTIQQMQVKVVATKGGSVRHMKGKTFTFEVYADNEYEVIR